MAIPIPFTICSWLCYIVKNRHALLPKWSEKYGALHLFVLITEVSVNFQEGNETQVTPLYAFSDPILESGGGPTCCRVSCIKK